MAPPAQHAEPAAQRAQRDSPPAGRPRRLLLVLHGKRMNTQIRDAVQRLKAEGHEVTVRVTFASGDVEQFVREALALWDEHSFDALVAGGGDGTLNELVGACLKHGAPHTLAVAQLPLGTANDFASAAGISLDPYEALRLALDPATAVAIDVALCNGEVFTGLATAGPVSEVSSKEISGTLKKLLGPAAVLVAGVRHLFVSGLQPIPGVTVTYPISLDARPDTATPGQVARMRGDLLVLAVGQARQMGRMISLCPDALLDDGLLDVTIMFESLGKQIRSAAGDLLTKGFDEAAGGIKLLRVPWLVVESCQPIKCNRDGEPMEAGDSSRLVFELLPKRLRMHLPHKSALLLAGQAVAEGAAAPSIGLRTGRHPRPGLLRDLMRAQQPPGRLSRLLPRLAGAAWQLLRCAGLLAAGGLLGSAAQRRLGVCAADEGERRV